MTTPEDRDINRMESLLSLIENPRLLPIGDTLNAAIKIFEELESPVSIHIAEEAMRGLRIIASTANPSSELFGNPRTLPREITDLELLQLSGVRMELLELCYGCEMAQHYSDVTSGGSPPTRFYLKSIYNYISSLFLIDRSKPSHKGLPMGGKIIRVLDPLGVADILIPIQSILDEPFGEFTFGQAVLKNRHSDLVHGDFSPERVEHLVEKTNMRDPNQQEIFGQLIWRFFHRTIILYLEITSLLSSSGKDVGVAMMRYLQNKN